MLVYPSYDSETDGVVYHIVPDTTTCLAESISDIPSEAETSLSGMTLQSDEISEYFVEHHGRRQPANENAVRWVPLDNIARYMLQHVVAKQVFGHNYVGPVKEMLCSNLGAERRRHVLEIGTRTGTWVQEMASEFPHVQFRSLDMTPMIAHTPRSNVVFEVYDITEGLLLEDNSQDIVFVNVGIEMVRNYREFLCEVHRVLRPGGLLHVREYTPGIWDLHDYTQLPRRTNPIGCCLFDFIRSAVAKFGVDLDMCEKLPLWLAPQSDLWKGFASGGGFEDVRMTLKTFPSYPHADHPCPFRFDPQLIPLVEHYYTICIQDCFGLLRDSGVGIEQANTLIETAIEELKDPQNFSLYRAYIICATKRS